MEVKARKIFGAEKDFNFTTLICSSYRFYAFQKDEVPRVNFKMRLIF
jgi:hypothetical protein